MDLLQEHGSFSRSGNLVDLADDPIIESGKEVVRVQETVGVTLRSLGEGYRQVAVAESEATVGSVIRETGSTTQGRRIALNGVKAGPGTPVVEGDVVTLIPRVVGG